MPKTTICISGEEVTVEGEGFYSGRVRLKGMCWRKKRAWGDGMLSLWLAGDGQ